MIDTSKLLENILARDNMILAMNRVIKNKGIHGVDGMKTMNFENISLIIGEPLNLSC